MLVTLFFGSLSVRYLICSIALVPKVVIVSVLYFLVLHFVPFVAAILSVFVCKPRVSTCCHLRAGKEVLVHVRSADILTLLEGSLQIAMNVAKILEEQASRLPRNQSGTVQAPFCWWVRLTCTKDDRCFFIKEGESVFCSQQQCMDVRATFVSSGRAANFSCKHADLSNKRGW